MRTPARISMLLLLATACGFPRPDDVGGDAHQVGGQVRGLWGGADGVALRLQAEGSDTLFTVPANGAFSFPVHLAQGESYTVTVAANPAKHVCAIDAGVNGTVADADVTNISIACTGPAVAIALSAPWEWIFDPLQETQAFSGSVVTQDVAFTISGDGLISANVGGTAATLGKETAPFALPLGSTTLSVALTATGGLSKTYQLVFDRGRSVLTQFAYGKASNTGDGDAFGYSVALSGDTLAIGAYVEDSNVTGVNGNQADNNSAPQSGAVYVFVRNGTTWTQQAYIKASNTDSQDLFGHSLALSGNTLAVGAHGESSNRAGVNPPNSQLDNSANSAGAVYVFVRSGTTWTQQAYVKASNTDVGDEFGYSVALTGDTLAVGAPDERSNATGVNGNQTDNSASGAGAVYVFVRSGATWTQQAYVKASNTGVGDVFGCSVALSGDTLAVGALIEDSKATGVNGDQTNDDADASGAVYVFVNNGATWTQQAYIKASNTSALDFFGNSVALSGDTLAVGAPNEASNATGVDGNQADTSASGSGAVYVFIRNGTTWSQQAYVKASNTEQNDQFGFSVALSGDTLAVGAYYEDASAIVVDGNQTDNTAQDSGSVYLFVRNVTAWTQQTYVKASNTGANDKFGNSVALSGDALAVGAQGEDSNAIGVNGNQADNTATHDSGAVYLFR